MKFVQEIISIGVLLGMVMGGIAYFAKASELKMVEVRLDQKIVGDQILQIRQQMYQLENINRGTDCTRWGNERDRDQYRKLKETLEILQKKQDILLQQEKK